MIGVDELSSGKVDKKGKQLGVAVAKKGVGRPKGSKNKITMLKLLAEEAFRTNNATKMTEVLNLVVDQALNGDPQSQKLVWQSIVSNGVNEEKNATEKVEIKIGTMEPKTVTIDGTTLQEDE